MRCKNCEGGYIILGAHYITREMAIDVGDPRLEGQLLEYEYAQCNCCYGIWQDCEICGKKINNLDINNCK